MLRVDESFNQKSVRLPVGQLIALRLSENPTTGFRWTFAADGRPYCTVIGDRFKRPAGPPGAGGEHVWRFKAVRSGTCHLKLLYLRPFEPAAPPARTFTLDVQITK